MSDAKTTLVRRPKQCARKSVGLLSPTTNASSSAGSTKPVLTSLSSFLSNTRPVLTSLSSFLSNQTSSPIPVTESESEISMCCPSNPPVDLACKNGEITSDNQLPTITESKQQPMGNSDSQKETKSWISTTKLALLDKTKSAVDVKLPSHVIRPSATLVDNNKSIPQCLKKSLGLCINPAGESHCGAIVGAVSKSPSEATTFLTSDSNLSNKPSRKREPDGGWRCGGCDGCRLKQDCVNKRVKSYHDVDRKRNEKKEANNCSPKSVQPQIGTRVYAKWHENNSWYWGTIIGKTEKINPETLKSERFFDVRFDDGDERQFVPIEELETEERYLKLFPERKIELEKKKTLLAKKKSRKKRATKDEVFVGARCYAKFASARWYWGRITKIEGDGIYMKCSVKFDDGDTRDGIRRYDELQLPHEMDNMVRCYADLETRRCGKCFLCSSPDCGNCVSCVTNKNSTTTLKECCLLRVCMELSATFPVPKFPKRWNYQLVDGRLRPEYAPAPLHPSLAGFRVFGPNASPISGDGEIYYSLEDAGASIGLVPHLIRMAEQEIFEEFLGLKIRLPESHELVGRGFAQEWLHFLGHRNLLFGIVESCARSRYDGSLLFTIRYDQECISRIPKTVNSVSIPHFGEVSERCALAGFLLYQEKKSNLSGPPLIHRLMWETTAIPLRWMVPESVTTELMDPDRFSNGHSRPKQVAIFRETRLEFETKKSSIPKAGLGVFLRCTNIGSGSRDHFILENGELLDIGVYAPLSEGDFKDGSLFLFKNFIYQGECEVWSFDAVGCEAGRLVFDITDDNTGELHNTARHNLVAYVNETNGKEIPSVKADHDPEGAVHYLLGHSEVSQGPLVIPMGTWVEIKIDYGPMYEPVRVRKGYSRLPAAMRERAEKSEEANCREILKDVGSWSVRDIELCVSFLERLNLDLLPSPSYAGTFTISIRLYLHLLDVSHAFSSVPLSSPSDLICDNGFSSMEEKKVIARSKECIKNLLWLWKDDIQLKTALLKVDYVAFYIGLFIDTDPTLMAQMDGTSLRLKIQDKLM